MTLTCAKLDADFTNISKVTSCKTVAPLFGLPCIQTANIISTQIVNVRVLINQYKLLTLLYGVSASRFIIKVSFAKSGPCQYA